MELNQLLESSNNYKTLQADAARLSGKWAKSGLLEGISGEIDRNNMSMILENQAKQLVSETSATGTGASFAAGQGEQWAGVALPLVRKVFAQIATKDFLSVQPMNLPSGLIFYLDFKYGSNSAGFTADSNMYGNVSTANSKIGVNVDAAGGLYGAGRFGYSMNDFTSSALSNIGTGVYTALSTSQFASSSVATDAVFKSALNYDTVVSASLASTGTTVATLVRVFVSSSAIGASQFASKSVRSFAISGSNINTYYPQFTTTTDAGLVTFLVSGSGTISGVVVTYDVQPNDNSRGDFEDLQPKVGSATTISIPEINVQLASEAIVAKTRKLKAQWTPEFAQDLNAYHSIDAEAELTSLLSEYISMEIDLELLDMLIQDARTVEYWSALNNQVYSSGAGAFAANTSNFYNTQGQWFQTLGTKVQKVSNLIHQKTLRGGANFLVCSPTVATILESIPGYAADTNGDKMDFAMGVQKVGQLNSRFRVYKNPYMVENTILLGYRGSQFLETGAVYAPYIPLIMTPLVYDPATFTPRKGIMTRYAKKMIRPEFYGKILVSDLNTL